MLEDMARGCPFLQQAKHIRPGKYPRATNRPPRHESALAFQLAHRARTAIENPCDVAHQ
jgi:hypothetical protein